MEYRKIPSSSLVGYSGGTGVGNNVSLREQVNIGEGVLG